ncbi:MAG: ferritin family protein [Thermodesulfobacteriota bacterium]
MSHLPHDLREAFKAAIEREIQARQFYLDIAAASDERRARLLFEKLAKEEEKHKSLLESEYDAIFLPEM